MGWSDPHAGLALLASTVVTLVFVALGLVGTRRFRAARWVRPCPWSIERVEAAACWVHPSTVRIGCDVDQRSRVWWSTDRVWLRTRGWAVFVPRGFYVVERHAVDGVTVRQGLFVSRLSFRVDGRPTRLVSFTAGGKARRWRAALADLGWLAREG